MEATKRTEIKSVNLSELSVGKYQVWSHMTDEVFARFLEDIKENGIHELIHVDENNVILDGHHRYEVSKQAEIDSVDVKVHYSLSEEDKQEFIRKSNTHEKSKKEKIAQAIALRKQGRSQRQIADWLGVTQPTIGNWLQDFSIENNLSVEKIEGYDGKSRSAEAPKVDEVSKRREQVKELRENGVKPADIARELGAKAPTIHNDLKAIEKAEKQAEKEREEKKRIQEMDMLEFEAKLVEESAPQTRDDEPLTSPDNTIICARRKALDASASIAGAFNILSQTDGSVKETYIKQVKSLVETGLITLGQFSKNDSEKEIVYMCWQMIKNLNELGEEEIHG